MSFIAQDIGGILIALPAIFLITLAPGRFFADILAVQVLREASGGIERAGFCLLVGASAMPVLLDLAGHFGPNAMLATAIVLAIPGLRKPQGWFQTADQKRAFMWLIAALALWTIFAIALLVDWRDGDGLHRSMQSADHVKHAAATWAIAQSGTPPYNPTFYEPGAKSAYYYFFYNLTATAELLTQPLGVAARQAAWAGVIFAGVLLAALAHLIYRRAGFENLFRAAPAKSLMPWLLTLLATTGLDILPVVLIGGLMFHTWISDYEFWDTQVTSWLNSVLWVPHHVTGLAAAWMGFMALAGQPASGGFRWRPAVLAGLAFASCAGLSIYVAFGAALTALAFVVFLALQKRGADIVLWCVAGAIAGLVAAPWIVSLVSGRPVGAGEAPLAFEIRAAPILDLFVETEPLRSIGRLLTLPLAYAVAFGVYLLGAIVFWRRAGARGLAGDVAKLLVISAGVSFLVGTFLRSTVLLNDLGWRIMLFAQMSSLIWTLAAVRGGLFHETKTEEPPPLLAGLWLCIALGFCADIYGVIQMRRYVEESPVEIAMAPDERAAWDWMAANLPADAIVEENPDRPRAFGYGPYGHFRTAVADHYNGILFGSSKPAIERRIREVRPLFFDTDMSADTAAVIATGASISVVVIRSADPVFVDRNAWPWAINAIYANAHMRVIRIVPKAFAETRP